MPEFDANRYLRIDERELAIQEPKGLNVGRAVELFVQIANNPVSSEARLTAGINILRHLNPDALPAVIKSLGNTANLLLAAQKSSNEQGQLGAEHSKISLDYRREQFLERLGIDVGRWKATISTRDNKFLAKFVVDRRPVKRPKKDGRTKAQYEELFQYFFQNLTGAEIAKIIGDTTEGAVNQAISQSVLKVKAGLSSEELNRQFYQAWRAYQSTGEPAANIERPALQSAAPALIPQVPVPPALEESIEESSAVEETIEPEEEIETDDATPEVNTKLTDHQRIAQAWAEEIGLDQAERDALAIFLNPEAATNDTLSPNKLSALKKIVQASQRYIKTLSDDRLSLSHEEQFRLRQTTGGWYDERPEGKGVKLPEPKALSTILKQMPAARAPDIIQTTYTSLELLLEVIKSQKDR